MISCPSRYHHLFHHPQKIVGIEKALVQIQIGWLGPTMAMWTKNKVQLQLIAAFQMHHSYCCTPPSS